ncbi:hypothetical protein NDH23_000487 [Salmonella enterica subsp. enterica serovar Muenchen]|nr:hypothetical protein [Salmonella enterica]EBM8986765.1 hypothetical protein [Salmonella enterica subsp. enterica serovar Muenchen]EDU5726315.1 hypothetical protein [Salmonella enterica subsp. enterica serovar Typhimurium var. 5-]EAP3436567.1 hypothetical protein [Salmonella enterica]EAP5142116.1 hypothetical protein [Salmonella enterica]
MIKDLVASGHALADDMTGAPSVLIRCLAAQLEVQLVRANALAAENAHARERHVFIRALAVSILEHSGGRMDWRGAMEDATELLQTVDSVYAKTPATDAFLAEVRAIELDSLAGVAETMLIKFSNQQCSSDMHEVVGWKMVLQQATNRAAQLRKGVQS